MDPHVLNKALKDQDWVKAQELLAPFADRPDAHPSLLYNYGKVLIELSKFDEAVGALTSATERDPSHANAWFELGRAALQTEALKLAFDAFQEAAEKLPNDVDSLRNLGRVALRLGEYAVAQSVWARLRSDKEAELALYRIAAETDAPDAELRRASLLKDYPDRAQALKTLVRTSKGAIPLNL